MTVSLTSQPYRERAVRLSCVTVTTVGYGDIAPTTAAGKWFSCVYLLIGTVLMAKALKSIPIDHQVEVK